jgi:hypothetical protein
LKQAVYVLLYARVLDKLFLFIRHAYYSVHQLPNHTTYIFYGGVTVKDPPEPFSFSWLFR